MPVQLYYTIASPPARAVMLTLKNLDIPHELHNVNLLKGEHKSDEFLKVRVVLTNNHVARPLLFSE